MPSNCVLEYYRFPVTINRLSGVQPLLVLEARVLPTKGSLVCKIVELEVLFLAQG